MRHTTLIVSSCLMILSLSACALLPASIEPATFKAEPLKGDPRITFDDTGDRLLIDVINPSGIGSAAIDKTSGQWPDKIVMRLHLKGLESFTFQYADTTIAVAVSSHGDNTVSETFEQPGKSGEVAAGDPYWIAMTPGAGYYDLEAPVDFLKSGESRFTIEWIDFYR